MKRSGRDEGRCARLVGKVSEKIRWGCRDVGIKGVVMLGELSCSSNSLYLRGYLLLRELLRSGA